MSNNKETTNVHEEEINLDELIGSVSAQNIIVPETKNETKSNMFSRAESVDLSFLDKEEEETENSDDSNSSANSNETAPESKITKNTAAEIDALLNPENPGDESDSKKGGRHNGLVELTKKLIAKGQIVPFEGEEDVEKYTIKDFEDLFEANNIQSAENKGKIKEEVSLDFFKSLPEELQVAAHYAANGGNDFKSLFKSLAAVEEIKSLDAEDEEDAEDIVRSYYYAKQFGSSEEIESEIEDLKDADKIIAKAKQFKPKLDAMQDQIVARKLEDQSRLRALEQAQMQKYTDDIYKVLEPGELNGLKLDKKTQNDLFGGLTQSNYPSTSGRPTNLLGHLLEKYQYVEPNHALITEALWLLKDPEGYRTKVREQGKKEAVTTVVKKLKSEESSKNTSSSTLDEDDNSSRKTQGAVKRPSGSSFFKR